MDRVIISSYTLPILDNFKDSVVLLYIVCDFSRFCPNVYVLGACLCNSESCIAL